MVVTTRTDASEPVTSRRDLMRTLAAGALASAAASGLGIGKAFAVPVPTAEQGGSGVRAYKLYTGPDNASHVLKGTIDLKDRTDVLAVHFKETPAHASDDWHNAPERQFVITLSGTLEFSTRDGETFVLRPGDVLVAEDDVGSGHKWRLIDDQPWRRAYVVLKPGAKDSFIPNPTA